MAVRMLVQGTTEPAFQAVLDGLREVYKKGESLSPEIFMITKCNHGWAVVINGKGNYANELELFLIGDDRIDEVS